MNTFSVFVYGTLKRGYWNHASYLKGSVAMVPATIPGRLHLRHTGTPILEIPRSRILAPGTTNFLSDAGLSPPVADQEPDAPEGFVMVHGELYTFDDPESRIQCLDELEEYVPDSPSLYQRVLTATASPRNTHAWTYIVPPDKKAEDYRPAFNPASWNPRFEGLAISDGELED